MIAKRLVKNKDNRDLLEIGRIATFGLSTRRDIVRRLIATSEFFREMTFGDAVTGFRYAEGNDLIDVTDNYIVVYHEF